MVKFFLKGISLWILLFPVLAFSQPNDTYYKGQFIPITFTGYYLGANIGWKWASYSTSLETAQFNFLDNTIFDQTYKFDNDVNSFLGGGQIGYNYQDRNFLFGLEADWNKSSLGKEQSVPPTIISPVFVPGDSYSTNNHWESSIRLRLGYVLNRWLFYGTTGLSMINMEIKTHLISPDIDGFPMNDSDETTLTGGTIGLGTEYAINKYWSVGVEYRYSKYPGKNFNLENLIISDFPPVTTEVTAKVQDFNTNQIFMKFNFRMYA